MKEIFKEIAQKREKLKKEWNRILPTNELLFDRWEKAKFAGAGEGTSIYDTCMILGDVKIGLNTWVGPYTLLDGSGGGLSIGDYCNISAGVHIYTHDSVRWSLSGGKIAINKNPSSIGNCCYIAPMSIVSMGVTLGNHCVVAANSFVNKSFPDNSIIAGTPAKKIGKVVINENNEINLIYDKK